jgi:hypothetical protein
MSRHGSGTAWPGWPVLVLENETYVRLGLFARDDTLRSHVPELAIDLRDVFQSGRVTGSNTDRSRCPG